MALAVSLSFIPLRLLGVEYAPVEDDNQLNVSLSMPAGTSLDAYEQASRQIEVMLAQIPEVQNVFTTVRGGGGGGMVGELRPDNCNQMDITLVAGNLDRPCVYLPGRLPEGPGKPEGLRILEETAGVFRPLHGCGGPGEVCGGESG